MGLSTHIHAEISVLASSIHAPPASSGLCRQQKGSFASPCTGSVFALGASSFNHDGHGKDLSCVFSAIRGGEQG